MNKEKAQYIDKDRIVTEIERRKSQFMSQADNFHSLGMEEKRDHFAVLASNMHSILSFLDTLEVKEVEEDSLEKFKSLQHISGDLKSTLQDWGYAPNLYYFDGSWHVDWISCEEGDSIHGFTAETPEEAIDKAYNWFHSTFCNS